MPNQPRELNEALVRSLPDKGPVVMVNLLKFRPRSADGDGTGWDAYVRYSQGISKLMKGVGATVLWSGKTEGPAYGDPNIRHWDFIVLVRYPSRKAFLDMVTSPAYAIANVERENGAEDHVILAANEMFSRFPTAIS